MNDHNQQELRELLDALLFLISNQDVRVQKHVDDSTEHHSVSFMFNGPNPAFDYEVSKTRHFR